MSRPLIQIPSSEENVTKEATAEATAETEADATVEASTAAEANTAVETAVETSTAAAQGAAEPADETTGGTEASEDKAIEDTTDVKCNGASMSIVSESNKIGIKFNTVEDYGPLDQRAGNFTRLQSILRSRKKSTTKDK